MSAPDTVIEARDLNVAFEIGAGLFGRHRTLRAVNNVTFDIRRGEVLAIVGESGCGKTTLARTLLGLQSPTAGHVLLEGRELTELDRRSVARIVQPVFQDPYSSLNPRKTIASIIALPLIVQGRTTANERRARVREIMELVGLSPALFHSYPSQLSGGQRQRVAIARALVARPRLVVCDEPTSALDVSVQAQILNLLQDLREEFDLTYVFISHDLSVVQHLADRVAVMYLGRIVEIGPTADVLGQGRHPYTKLLLSSVLPPDPDHQLPETSWDGGYPDPTAPPSGCHFHPRCPQVMDVCRTQAPAPVRISDSIVACHRYPEPGNAMPG